MRMNGAIGSGLARAGSALCLVLFAAGAAAQRPAGDDAFAALDRDGNGSITRAEFAGTEAQFAAMDKDRDGKVTPAELAASPLGKAIPQRERSDVPPRARVDLDALRIARLALIARFDLDRDGRVRATEWRGDPVAFGDLDLDGNGVLDGADKKLAQRRVAEPSDPARAERAESELPQYLPSAEDILRRRDKDGDGVLSESEAAGAGFGKWFARADRNGDRALDQDELSAVAREVTERADRRSRGRERPFTVPFGAWDRDHDGALTADEWQERQNLLPRVDLDRDGRATRAEVARYERSLDGNSFLERFDLDGDGSVTAAEFGGPLPAFQRADRNGDGVVSGADR
jgi:Ca2+-binding EF-hand superfamily protein